MDTTTFKLKLKSINVTQSEFAATLGINPATFRSDLRRIEQSGEQVPSNWEAAATNATQSDVASPDATQENVAKSKNVANDVAGKLTVMIPWPDDPAWDVMSDGWPRGYPGDTNLTRAYYRTSGAWRRHKGYQDNERIPELSDGRMFKITKDLTMEFM